MRRVFVLAAVSVAISATSIAASAVQVGFSSPGAIPIGSWAYGTEIADVTGDGLLDLIVTTHGFNDPALDWKVLVLAQQLDGTLSSPTIYDPEGTEPYLTPAVGDLDDDGDTDLAVSYDGGIDIFLQDGGLLTGPTSYASPGHVIDVAVADIDGDGRDDVVYSIRGEGSHAYVRRSQLEDGTLGEPTEIGTGPGEWFELADVTDDGRPDLIVESPSVELLVLVQQGDGSFSATTDSRIDGPAASAIADVTGDGELDLVHMGSGGLNVMAGDGDGGLSDPVLEGPGGTSIEIADLNGDALLDVVAFGSATSVLVQDGAGGLSSPCGFPGPLPGSVGHREVTAVGDLDGDGRPDAVAAGLVDPLPVAYQLAADETVGSSIEIDGPNDVTVGEEIDIDGAVEVDGGCITVGTVALWRKVGNQPAESIDTDDLSLVDDGRTGSFAFTTVVPAAGNVTYFVSWAGGNIHEGARSGDLDLDVDRTMSQLTLRGDALIDVGQRSTLTATLKGPDDGHVSFYEVRPGGGERLLTTKSVNNQGKAAYAINPKANTRFVARFAGHDTAKASSDSLLVKVRVITTATMTHESFQSAGYAVYDCCRSYVWFKVAPNHGGDQVTMKLQIYFQGAWRSYDPWTFKLRPNSTQEIYVEIDGGSGYRFRAQVCMPTHGDHVGDCSSQVYFRYR